MYTHPATTTMDRKPLMPAVRIAPYLPGRFGIGTITTNINRDPKMTRKKAKVKIPVSWMMFLNI